MDTSLLVALSENKCYNKNVLLPKGLKKMVITFCGHSNYLENINDKEYILNILEDLIKNKDVDFYIGGYVNFDYFALK